MLKLYGITITTWDDHNEPQEWKVMAFARSCMEAITSVSHDIQHECIIVNWEYAP